jgi:DNA-binding response OmpR family regulator
MFATRWGGALTKSILVIEDDLDIQRLTATILQGAGFQVQATHSGLDGLRLLQGRTFDLVLLDLGLPDIDGGDVCRQIRAVSSVPIIMVTARGDDTDKVIGLEIGADDYVTKPFHKHELVARVRALLRRAEQWSKPVQPQNVSRLKVGSITVGIGEHRVWVNEEEVQLTHTEYDLLVMLMQNAGLVVSRDALLEKIWGINAIDVDTRTVDNHIARLRKKLSTPLGGDRVIDTVPSVGYRFRADW